MNSWSSYKKHFAWISFSHWVPPTIKKIILFLSSELLLVCWVCSSSLESRLKETGRPRKNWSSGAGKIPILWFRTVFSLLHCRMHIVCICAYQCFSPTPTVLRLLALAFHWKMTSVVMWCGLLNIVYVAFLVSVKSFKTLMCKMF